MKEQFTAFKSGFPKMWKYYLARVGFLILGLYLFTLGISIYSPTAVGASHMDLAIFSIIGTIHGVDSDAKINLDYYSNMLTIYFVAMLTTALIFGLIASLIEYKKTKKASSFISLAITIALDLIIVFALPQIINLQWMYIPQLSIQNIENVAIRNWIFIGAYLINMFGVAFWVLSNLLGGPYNAICTQFIRLTKLKYNVARMISDIIITFPAFIFILANNMSWQVKGDFLLNYLNFGSICFVILTGPVVAAIIKLINKVWDIEKYKEKLLAKN